MAFGDVLEAAIYSREHGQVIVNVIHYLENGAGVGDNRLELAVAVDLNIGLPLLGVASTAFNYEQTGVARIKPIPRTSQVFASANAGPGTQASPALPTEVAVVLTKRTGFAGRKFRGRLYIAGIVQDAVLNSQLTAVGLANYQILANQFAMTLVTLSTSFIPVLFHRVGQLTDGIQDVLARPVLRAQRRRQVGVGV